MNKRAYPKFALIVFTLILGLTVSVAYGQDLTLHLTTTSSGMRGAGAGSTTSTHYLSSKAMKTASSEGHDSIIQFDSGKIISIDNKQKTYTEMTIEQLSQMLNKQAANMGMDNEKMEQMRKMMGNVADSFSVTKVGAERLSQAMPPRSTSSKAPWKWKSTPRPI